MSEANVIADAVHRMEQDLEDVKKQLVAMTAERDEWKHTAGVYQYDNDNLKKVINRSNAKADHYMKQHAGLSNGLRGVVEGLIALIKSAEVHAYGDRDNRGAPQRPERPAEITQMPRFLRGEREATG